MKTCCRCKKEKELLQFHKHSGRQDGYNSHCKSCEKKRWHKWYLENSQQVKDNVRWWLDNSEEYRSKNRAWGKRWRENNKERQNQASKTWAKANRKRFLAKKKEWYRANPHKATEYNHARRTRKLGNGGILMAKQIMELKLSNPECAICKSVKNLEVDHIIPLSAGGRNDIDNVQILCRLCNRSKWIYPHYNAGGAGSIEHFIESAKKVDL